MALKNNTILVFIDWYYPGYKAGGPIRSIINLTENLSEINFKIITRNTDYTETVPYNTVPSNAWHMVTENVQVMYLPEEDMSKRSLDHLINETEFDLAYINGVYSKWFSIVPLQILNNTNKPLVIAARGMLSPNAIGVKPLKKKAFLTMAKLTGLYRRAVFHATNEGERRDIQSALGNKYNIKVAPNFPRNFNYKNSKAKQGEVLKLVSVARIAPEKNTKFAIDLLNEVKAPVQFDLYGAIYNMDYWKECENCITKLPKHVSVKHHGNLPADDVGNVLRNSDALLFPTLGENFGHVIYESLSCGTPVIISNRTPWQNLHNEQVGWDISLDAAIEFVAKIEELATISDVDYQKMGNCALKYARNFVNDELLEANRKLFA